MKRFNIEELLWFIVLSLLTISIIYLVYTNKLEFYIGHKMVKYMYISIFMLATITCFQFSNVFTTKGNVNLKVKILPIIFALIVGFISVTNQNEVIHNQLYDNMLNECNDYDIENGKYKDIIDDDVVKIDDNNLEILEDIKNNPGQYSGKSIIFNGFVCKDQYLKNNQFLIGRILMTCCAADSKIVGIFAQYSNSDELDENDWVKVEGTIHYIEINDDDGVSHRVPIIQISKLEKVPQKTKSTYN